MTAKPADANFIEPDREAQVAQLTLAAGKARLKVRVRVTPAGVLAIGGLVSSILLSTAALVWVSTSVTRRHAIAARLPRR